MTRSLASEYAGQTGHPREFGNAAGVIKTPMHAPETHAFLARAASAGPDGGEKIKIVDAVLYLESAGFVTGETLFSAGGCMQEHWLTLDERRGLSHSETRSDRVFPEGKNPSARRTHHLPTNFSVA